MNKIDLNLFTKYLYEKDEYTNNKFKINYVNYSSYFKNQLLFNTNLDSYGNSSDNENLIIVKAKRKRNTKARLNLVSKF